jgi:hypothetical protein
MVTSARAAPARRHPFRIAAIPNIRQVPTHVVMLQQSLRELGWEYGREYQLRSPDIPAFAEITDEQIRTVVEARPDLILTFFHAARIQNFIASIPGNSTSWQPALQGRRRVWRKRSRSARRP